MNTINLLVEPDCSPAGLFLPHPSCISKDRIIVLFFSKLSQSYEGATPTNRARTWLTPSPRYLSQTVLQWYNATNYTPYCYKSELSTWVAPEELKMIIISHWLLPSSKVIIPQEFHFTFWSWFSFTWL